MIKNKLHPSQECKFQQYLNSEKIKYARILSMLGILLYAVFMVVDVWSLPSSLNEALIIRSVIIAGFFIVFGLTYWHNFSKYYQLITSTMFIMATIGVLSVIHLSIPSDIAYEDYYVGLVLLVVSLIVWTHLELSLTIALLVFVVSGYVAIEIYERNILTHDRIPVLTTNLIFILSAILIGLLEKILRDGYLRQNFLLQLSLKHQVSLKAEEAETHEHLANHDQLTGLPNRRYAETTTDKYLSQAKEFGMSLVIMYLDLNGFKKINDDYGHNAGDEVLRVVSKRLKSSVRNGDCLARLGGDEFMVALMVKKDELHIAENISKGIRKSISQPISFEGCTLQVGTSIGMASYPENGGVLTELMDIADNKMYEDKTQSKVLLETEFKKKLKSKSKLIEKSKNCQSEVTETASETGQHNSFNLLPR